MNFENIITRPETEVLMQSLATATGYEQPMIDGLMFIFGSIKTLVGDDRKNQAEEICLDAIRYLYFLTDAAESAAIVKAQTAHLEYRKSLNTEAIENEK